MFRWRQKVDSQFARAIDGFVAVGGTRFTSPSRTSIIRTKTKSPQTNGISEQESIRP